VWIFDDVTGELTAAAEATAARDELAQSEQRFRLLTEHAAAAVFSTDTSGKYTWIAQSVTDLLGWLPDQVLGRTPFDFVHPDDHGMVRAGIEANLRGEPVHLRARFRQIDGNYRWITVTARGVLDEQGSIVERIGSWHDAEAEVAAEQALREQADFLHAVLDAELEPHVYMRAIRNDAGDIVDFAYSDVNAAACDYLSLTHEQLNGARLLDILPGQAGSGMLALYAEAVRTGEPLVLDDYMYPHELLGAERRYDIRAVKVGDGLSFTWRDVTERYNAAHHLAEAKQRFELLAQNASDLVALATPVGVVQWFSESISLYGWSPEDVIGRTMHDFVHPADAHILSDVNEIIAAGHEAVRELRLRHKDDANRWHWFRVHLRPVMDDDGTIIGRVSGWRNIDIERAESELLEQERQRLAATLDSMLNPHIMVRAVRDAEGTVVDFEYRDANRAALAYLRVARDELLGSRIRERYGTGADMMMGWLVAVVDTGEPLERDDVPIVSAVTGGERWMDVKAVRVGDEVAFTWQDVTERHEATELLRHLAGHDALTGLPNRAHILDRLETLLSRPSVARDHTAVVFCDLDDMKTVNDTLGHAAGDLLLTETARRVTTIVADDGIVSRFGGDEILVVLTSISGMDQARAVAERLRAAIAEPIQVPESGSVVSSSASIGVTLAHPGDNVDGLIARADQAMYEAKSSGRNRVVSRP
jgi:diguanylate cyclase (GGDEF)-like protein/PAS domain S-box-containing protein